MSRSRCQKFSQVMPTGFHRSMTLVVHPPVEQKDLASCVCQLCATAALSAANDRNERFAKATVGVPYKVPGSHIGDAHAFGRRPQTSGLQDQFQQVHPARPQGNLAAEHDSQPGTQPRLFLGGFLFAHDGQSRHTSTSAHLDLLR